MTAPATVARQHFLTQEGEQLLISFDAMQTAERMLSFVTATGLEPAEVISDPITTHPLPVYHRDTRFSTVKPELMWHPLFWVPEHVGLRLQIRESENAEPRVETDSEWALRVAIELTRSDIYAPEGGWADVMALCGLDLDNPIDLARVEAWRAGEVDETLDAIDLGALFAFSADNEAFYEAQELYPALTAAQWGFTAVSLLESIDEDREGAGAYAGLGAEMLADERSPASDELLDAEQRISRGEDIDTLLPVITSALQHVLDTHVDAMHELDAIAA